MIVGVVTGDFSPITKEQVNTILRWKKENKVHTIYVTTCSSSGIIHFEDRLKMLEIIFANYRNIFVSERIPKFDSYISLELDSYWNFDVSILDGRVCRYLIDNEILIYEIAKQFVSAKRWIHVESMTKIAIELAQIHGVNTHKALVAGLFHDCTKQWDDNKTLMWLKIEGHKHIDEPITTLHQYTAVTFMKRVLRINDKEILSAVGNHVSCNITSKLAKIIYSSDKLDPSRGYDSSDTIKLCEMDLDAGVEEVKRQQEIYLNTRGKKNDL